MRKIRDLLSCTARLCSNVTWAAFSLRLRPIIRSPPGGILDAMYERGMMQRTFAKRDLQ